MGYTLYFKTGNDRCGATYQPHRQSEDIPACFLPKMHFGPHVSWDSLGAMPQVWWIVKDGKPLSLEEALKSKK